MWMRGLFWEAQGPKFADLFFEFLFVTIFLHLHENSPCFPVWGKAEPPDETVYFFPGKNTGKTTKTLECDA